MGRKMIVCVDQRFGRLVVVSQESKRYFNGDFKSYVVCVCDCGVTKGFWLYLLKRGSTKSCGCLVSEKVRDRQTTHNKSRSLIYSVWKCMKERCNNPRNQAYKNYGARGITVCDSWLKFENFYADMGDPPKGLQLDRIDNNKGYSEENCHWTTIRGNQRNTRRSKYWFVWEIRYDSLSHASEKLGVSDSTIRYWCTGKFQRGTWVPPKVGCYFELKYLRMKNYGVKGG